MLINILIIIYINIIKLLMSVDKILPINAV